MPCLGGKVGLACFKWALLLDQGNACTRACLQEAEATGVEAEAAMPQLQAKAEKLSKQLVQEEQVLCQQACTQSAKGLQAQQQLADVGYTSPRR